MVFWKVIRESTRGRCLAKGVTKGLKEEVLWTRYGKGSRKISCGRGWRRGGGGIGGNSG